MQAGAIIPFDLSSNSREEELLDQLREEKLGNMLALEMMDHDDRWVDYEFEENQTKLDLADIVLEHLVMEVLDVVNL